MPFTHKYKPKTTKDIVGQDKALRELKEKVSEINSSNSSIIINRNLPANRHPVPVRYGKRIVVYIDLLMLPK